MRSLIDRIHRTGVTVIVEQDASLPTGSASVRFTDLFSRHPADADLLAARCAAADRVVAERVAALARAGKWHEAAPDSAAAVAALEAAEELLYVAEYQQRKARAALVRAGRRRRFARSGDDAAGAEPSA
jgi:hypothetical protein